ncbi:MAG: protein-export chaperone SecB [Stappiaceae bacterium]
MTDTNELAGGNAQDEAQSTPGMNVLAQYIKDLSFENPGAPSSLQPNGQPKLDINVNVNANPIGEAQFEVTLLINAKAANDSNVLFNVEIAYGGVFQISGVPQEHLHPFVMIECPRMLFPFARQIVSDATRNGGFPPLLIDPIDFANLYRQNMAKQAAAQPPEGTPAN